MISLHELQSCNSPRWFRIKYAVAITFIIAILFWLFSFTEYELNTDGTFCIIKNVTGFPCPACGTGHSVVSILHFHFIEALFYNPLGYLLFFCMIVSCLWMLKDIITNKESFLSAMKKKISWKIMLPFFSLVILNWIWNFYKY